jgi:hypothetical protein
VEELKKQAYMDITLRCPMIMKSIADDFLKIFFRLHGAIIKEQQYGEGIVDGQVFWPDDEDDIQKFRWHIETSEEDVRRMKLLCDFLFEKKLVGGDRIIITEINLINAMREADWEVNCAELAIDALMSTEVKMVDEGEETDSFFIHF